MDKKLWELYGFRPAVYKGDDKRWPDLFGIELELEDLSDTPEIAGWTIKPDGSLRNGYEYILRKPLGGKELAAAVDRFYTTDIRYTNGPRTSTHIHVTAGDMSVDNLRSMIILMYTIEDALFNAIGEIRKWAGYAMPLREMEPGRMRDILSSQDEQTLYNAISPRRNQERYYGFNICVQKHGTVEFRYFPGGPTKEELVSWVDLVQAIKRAAMSNTAEGLVNIANSPDDLIRFLRAALPEQWYTTLTRLGTPEEFFANYSEVSALYSGEDSPRRREPLVFATKPLIGFITKNLLPGNGGKFLANLASKLPVMSLADWQEYVMQAVAAERAKDSTKAKTTRGPEPEAQFNPFGNLPDAVPAPAPWVEWDAPRRLEGYMNAVEAQRERIIRDAQREIVRREQDRAAQRLRPLRPQDRNL